MPLENKAVAIERFVDVFKQTHKLIFQAIQQSLHNNDDLQYSAYYLLHYVNNHEGCTQRQIARDFFHTEAAISRKVNELVIKGYLVRTIPSKDRRKSIIKLSETGRGAVKDLEKHIRRVLADIFADLTVEELQTITEQNNRIQSIVAKGLKAGNL